MPLKNRREFPVFVRRCPAAAPGGFIIVERKLKREKVGRKGDAIPLYQQRKSETRAGAKLTDNMCNTGGKFKDLSDAILTYSSAHHRDTRNIKNQLSRAAPRFRRTCSGKDQATRY